MTAFQGITAIQSMKKVQKTQGKKVRANKQFFDTRKEAILVAKDRRTNCFKMTWGRHKGKFFVGSQLEWFSL